MEIVTDYSEVVIETGNLIMKKAVFGDWEQLYRNITSRPESAKYMLWKEHTSERENQRYDKKYCLSAGAATLNES